MNWALSDDQYIARLRIARKYRRVLGTLEFVGGIALIALCWSVFGEQIQHTMTTLESMRQEHPLSKEDELLLNGMGHGMGLMQEAAIGAAALGGLYFVCDGIASLLGKNRTVELLLSKIDADTISSDAHDSNCDFQT